MPHDHRGFLALVVGLLTCGPLHAQAPNILAAVDAHYNHLTTLRAHYTEHYTGMGQDRTESGTLLLKKPGRMAWHYDSPASKLFLLDGHNAWFYTPGDPQAQRIPAKQIDDLRTPLRFLLGHTELQKELENITVTPQGTQTRIVGTPRGQQQRIKSLTLLVNPTGAITNMQMEEQDGSQTTFTFTTQQENTPASDKDFTFTPPPGVTVVNGSAPI